MTESFVSYAADGSPVIVVPQHSDNYLRWCSQGNGQRKREKLEWQRWKCWCCGEFLSIREADLHHLFYDNLGYEEASDLVAVHKGRCHRVLEAEKAAEMRQNLDAHWTSG